MKLTEIVPILEISPIEGADRIERATVLNWTCVVRKGLHKVGDRVIFVFPDTNVPKKFLDESYVGDEKVRLRTVKMKGQYSAGLILPLSLLAPVPDEAWQEGQDVAELLGIEKWELPMTADLAGTYLGDFPSIVSKTDEDNYRSNPEALKELEEDRFKDEEFYASTKCDGTSGTFIRDPNDDRFRVCSRNRELKEDDSNTLWKIANKYQIKEYLQSVNRYLAIQGEVCGEGIQDNPMKLKGQHLFVFLIKNLEKNAWLSWDETRELCQDSNYLLTVPELFRFTHNETSPLLSPQSLQDIANKTTYDTAGQVKAEGIVVRPVRPIPSSVLGKSWWSVKFISEPYDMKKG